MRLAIARRLSGSMAAAPHYYLTVTADAGQLLSVRAQLNAALAAEQGPPPSPAAPAAPGAAKISLNAFLLKLAAGTLRRHPRVNATWNGDTITLHGAADIALAVALDDGLVAPIVRGCGAKSLFTIETELADLVARARACRLAPGRVQGAGFTVSNLGPYGIEEFTAIINPPGSAILAVGAIERVRWRRRGGPHRGQVPDEAHAFVRPPGHRRGGGGRVPRGAQGGVRESRAGAAASTDTRRRPWQPEISTSSSSAAAPVGTSPRSGPRSSG